MHHRKWCTVPRMIWILLYLYTFEWQKIRIILKETYLAHIRFTCSHVHHFPQTVQCCSSSSHPLSETLGLSSRLFKWPPLQIKPSLLWLASWPTWLWLINRFQWRQKMSTAALPLLGFGQTRCSVCVVLYNSMGVSGAHSTLTFMLFNFYAHKKTI